MKCELCAYVVRSGADLHCSQHDISVYPTDFCHFFATRKSTHADRIRAMTDEELAEFLQVPHCNRISDDDCKNKYLANCTACWLDWLRQEAKPCEPQS